MSIHPPIPTPTLHAIDHTWAWQTLNRWWLTHLGPWNKDETATVVILVVAVTLAWLSGQVLARFGDPDPVRRRRVKMNVRNGIALVTMILLLGVWMVELKTFALSVAALITASVIAFKEPISSIVGSMVVLTRRTYVLGDRIEINGHQGEVLDKTLLTTTILENGGTRTNRGVVLVLPNHWFLVHSVRNFSHLGRYHLGLLQVSVPASDNPFIHRAWLLDAATAALGDTVERAGQAFSALPRSHGIDWPTASPSVDVVPQDSVTTHLVLRFPCLSGQEDHAGQTVLEGYWARRSAAQDDRLEGAAQAGSPEVMTNDATTVP